MLRTVLVAAGFASGIYLPLSHLGSVPALGAGYDYHGHEETFLGVWAAGCLIGGLVLAAAGAPAVALALLGSVAGATVGLVTSPSPESIAVRATVGATIGAVVAGSAGLAWKPAVPRWFLNALGFVIAAAGAAAVFGVHHGATTNCNHGKPPHGGGPCLPAWALGNETTLLAFDVVFLVILCLVQARQVPRAPRLLRKGRG